MLSPEAFIGAGKETGDIEYSADSLTVLMRPQLTQGAYDNVIAELFERGGRPIMAVTAKWRAGTGATWFALAHEQGRFSELPEESMNSLVPTEGEGSGAGAQSDPLALVREVVEVVRKAESEGAPLKTRTAICARVSGRKQLTLEAIKRALREGFIDDANDFRASRCKPLPEPPKAAPGPSLPERAGADAQVERGYERTTEQGKLDLEAEWLP